MLCATQRRLARAGGGALADTTDLENLRIALNDASAGYQFIAYDVRENFTTSGGVVTGWSASSASNVSAPAISTISGSPAYDSVAQEITFDGSDDRLYTALSSVFNMAGAWTIAVVGKFPSAANDRHLVTFGDTNGTSGQYVGINRSSATNHDKIETTVRIGAGNFVIQQTNVACGSERRMVIMTKSATTGYTIEVPYSGLATATGSTALTSANYRMIVGSISTTGGVFDGAISAVLLINRQITSGADLDALIAWAQNTWNCNVPAAGTQTVTSITVTLGASTISTTGSTTATAVVKDQNGQPMTSETVTFSSSNTGVATVNSTTGDVSPVGTGSCNIIATSVTNGAITGSAPLTVAAAGTIASVRVFPERLFMETGDTRQMTAVAYDAAGAEVSGGSYTWTTSPDPSVYTVNSSGLVTAVGQNPTAGSGITLTVTEAGGQVATAKVFVFTTMYEHEPAGMTAETEREFIAKAPGNTEGWNNIEANYSNFTVFAEPNDPWLPSGGTGNAIVGQMRYPTGFTGGVGAGTAYYQMSGTHKTGYFCVFVLCGGKQSTSNPATVADEFYGHKTSTNKAFFLVIAGGANFFVSGEGRALNSFAHCLRYQGGAAGQVARKFPNQITTSDPLYYVERGYYEKWEFVLTTETTAGGFDGVSKWWVNGKLIADYSDVNYKAVGAGDKWTEFRWNPTWGGGGDTMPWPSWWQFGLVKASSK